jgi:hypothetical protein
MEKEEIETQLNNSTDYIQIEKLAAQLTELNKKIDASTERWMELAEIAG